MEIIFWPGTISLVAAQYVSQYLVWHKNFGPVEGRGICVTVLYP